MNVLEVVEPVERRHRPGERAGRGAVDPADARPEVALAQPLEEAELHEHAVDGAAREDDRDIALHASQLRLRGGAFISHAISEDVVDLVEGRLVELDA